MEYAQDRDIPVVDIQRVQDIIYLATFTRSPVITVGETATGKTAVAEQLANQNDFSMLKINLVHAKPTELTGPMFPNEDGKTSSYLPDERIPFKGHANEDEEMFLFFDEPNRGSTDTVNAAMSAFDERRIGPHELGDNVMVIGAMNPPTTDYNITTQINEDAAVRRRICQVAVEFDPMAFNAFMRDPKSQKDRALKDLKIDLDFINRAKNEGWDPVLRKFLQENRDLMHDMQRKENNKLFPNPASWEQVNLTLKAMHEYKLWDEDRMQKALFDKIAGHVGMSVAQEFKHFWEKEEKHLDPEDILEDYRDESSDTHQKLKSLLQQQDNQRISMMLDNLAYTLFAQDDPAEYAESVGKLFGDLRMQFGEQLMENIDQHGALDDDSWSQELNEFIIAIGKVDGYKQFSNEKRELIDDMRQRTQ